MVGEGTRNQVFSNQLERLEELTLLSQSTATTIFLNVDY